MKPTEGKITCAEAVSPFVEAGNTHLPAPSPTRWVTEFLEELASFPAGAHDDQVDAQRKRCNASFLRATRVSTYLKQLAPLRENCGTPTLAASGDPYAHCAPEDSHHHMTGPPLGRRHELEGIPV